MNTSHLVPYILSVITLLLTCLYIGLLDHQKKSGNVFFVILNNLNEKTDSERYIWSYQNYGKITPWIYIGLLVITFISGIAYFAYYVINRSDEDWWKHHLVGWCVMAALTATAFHSFFKSLRALKERKGIAL